MGFGTINFNYLLKWFTKQIFVLGEAHFLVIGQLLLALAVAKDVYNGSHAIIVQGWTFYIFMQSCQFFDPWIPRRCFSRVVIAFTRHLPLSSFKASIQQHASEWKMWQVSPALCPRQVEADALVLKTSNHAERELSSH